MKRNLLNKDEILRLPTTKILVILRGNKPLVLDKMKYQEHPLANKLKDSTIFEYNPKWIKNITEKRPVKEKKNEKVQEKQKIGWDNF